MMAGQGRPKGSPRVEGSGRKPGVPNHATRDIKELAQQHGPAAIARLVELMNQTEFLAVARAAASELLDRAYGKPPQAVVGADEGPVKMVLSWLPREGIDGEEPAGRRDDSTGDQLAFN